MHFFPPSPEKCPQEIEMLFQVGLRLPLTQCLFPSASISFTDSECHLLIQHGFALAGPPKVYSFLKQGGLPGKCQKFFSDVNNCTLLTA